jgi:Spy/CpxP family protein refolding chaperone
MKKTKLQILLIGITVIALSAGIVAGILAARLPVARAAQTTADASSVGEGSLSQELDLTPDQQAQMRSIWEPVRGHVHETFQYAQRLQKERDEALVALLNDEQKARFEKISQDFANRFQELSKSRDRTFTDAVQKTRRLLNDIQRKKYDEILKNRVGETPARAYGVGVDGAGAGGNEPSTQPG